MELIILIVTLILIFGIIILLTYNVIITEEIEKYKREKEKLEKQLDKKQRDIDLQKEEIARMRYKHYILMEQAYKEIQEQINLFKFTKDI